MTNIAATIGATSTFANGITPLGLQFLQILDVMKGPIPDTYPNAVDSQTANQYWNEVKGVASATGVTFVVNQNLGTTAQQANINRSAVLTALQQGIAAAAIGSQRGYVLPADPTSQINDLNSGRQLFDTTGVSDVEMDRVVTDFVDLVKLGLAYTAGKVTFQDGQPGAQLSSFEVSVDGIAAQSGDALTDILGYQPDADLVQRQQALTSLASLSFSNRKPYLLFTADVVVDGMPTSGTIVCWQRMRDASGYAVAKRDVFNVISFPSASFSAADMDASTAQLKGDPHFRQLVSFYDWLGPDDYVAYADDATLPDTLYSYSVSGVQVLSAASPTLFDVPTTNLTLSQTQVQAVLAAISATLAQFGGTGGTDSVSPWPAIAQVVLGDPSYGWILAGVNMLASQRRGDPAATTRGLAFLGSKASVVTAAQLVVPSSVSSVQANVDAGVPAFGISGLILSVLDGTGVTLFTGQDQTFDPTKSSIQQVTGGLAKIIGAIDAGTATLDPQTLASALTVPTTQTSSGLLYRYSPIALQQATGVVLKVVPSLSQSLGNSPIDLTTYDGISGLLGLIRIIYDFYPGSLTA